ncbi:MAG TPA: phenylalanine--tRNA ligase subunit alpha, partial [Microthrixaceae bacterium]|nr:phenylalanine--tRNA ligase subunit alpha [Microthrixaceae bacterium]
MTDTDPLSTTATIVADGLALISSVGTLDALRATDHDLLGKTAPLSQLKASMRDVAPDQRKALGQALNDARRELETAIAERQAHFEAAARREQLAAEQLDLSEMIVDRTVGHHHLITQTRERLEDAFIGLGFTIAEGPEVETDWYNFEALNMPESHPARSMWDTLYVDLGPTESTVLRTHT